MLEIKLVYFFATFGNVIFQSSKSFWGWGPRACFGFQGLEAVVNPVGCMGPVSILVFFFLDFPFIEMSFQAKTTVKTLSVRFSCILVAAGSRLNKGEAFAKKGSLVLSESEIFRDSNHKFAVRGISDLIKWRCCESQFTKLNPCGGRENLE